MKKYFVFVIWAFLIFNFSYGQDIEYARHLIEKLSSKKMAGRGYIKHGDKKAAKFIARQFKKKNVKHFGDDFYQEFTFPVNTFPSKIKVKVGDKKLVPGREFVVYSNSPGVKGTFNLVWMENDTADKAYLLNFYEENNLESKLLVADQKLRRLIMKNPPPEVEGIILRRDKKIYWFLSIARQVNDFFMLDISTSGLTEGTKQISIEYDNEYIDDYLTRNVIGYVKGKSVPDSFFVFTAHYDHLGYMGKKAWFPGANDNASGTAMIMDLARHFAKPENQPDYSIAFMAFAGEETGLMGSGYYAEHPLFPLEKIKCVVNLDMIGTGSEGITVVNGEPLHKVFQKFSEINSEHDLLKDIKARGESCNSDHCPFYMKGIPAVFIYTRGKEFSEYHNPDDVARDLPLTEYEDLFKLLVYFVNDF